MTVHYDSGKTWGEVVAAYFKFLFQNFIFQLFSAHSYMQIYISYFIRVRIYFFKESV